MKYQTALKKLLYAAYSYSFSCTSHFQLVIDKALHVSDNKSHL